MKNLESLKQERLEDSVSSEVEKAVELRKGLESSQNGMVTKEDYTDIIRTADSLRQYDDKNREKIIRRSLDSEFPETPDSEMIPLSAAYRVAETFGIAREYVDRAIELKKPISEEDKARDLVEICSSPSQRIVSNYYTNNILRDLRNVFPLRKFKIYNWDRSVTDAWNFYIKEIVESKKRFLGIFKKTSKEKHTLITGKVKNNYIILSLYSPIILQTSKDTINKISEVLKKGGWKVSVENDYSVSFDALTNQAE